ncbi:hypothetical protein [Deinococcus yunweiensis]|uniref:hypothetical protein n=1 Tax=Deinococcus yunweiensis TaxID=367282 RepID=UPI00398E9537
MRSLPAPLAGLAAYHAPLSTLQREQGGAVTLLTPGVNVLALNVTYLPMERSGVDLDAVRDWHEGQGVPVLVASTGTVPGAREVRRVRVGTFAPPDHDGSEVGVVVEQVSRLHLPAWAQVVAQAHGTPDWAPALAHHLAARLDGDRNAALLLAYCQGEPVGALLWRAVPDGGAAHLWGTLDSRATGPLLGAAAALGGSLNASDAGQTVALHSVEDVIYLRLD